MANTQFPGLEWLSGDSIVQQSLRTTAVQAQVTFTATFSVLPKTSPVSFSNNVRLIPKCTLCFCSKYSFSLLTEITSHYICLL